MKSQRLIIKIKNNQRKIPINKKAIARLAKHVLKIKGIKKAELSILFASKQRIRKLNQRFRKQNLPTDVLAFCMREGKDVLPRQSRAGLSAKALAKANALLCPELLGDVVICPEVAQRCAKIYNNRLEKEICLYLIHGILHLLGYDDTSVKALALMKQEQSRILNKVMR